MIKVLKLDNSEEWNRIVKTFKCYDVYYLSGYVKGLETHGDGEPQLIYFENETSRAINVVMKRDIADDRNFQNRIEKGKYYDYSTPYGYGGFLIEGTDNKSLEAEYKEHCRKENIVCEFVRFHPLLKNWEQTIYEPIFIGNTIAMDTSSEVEIWNNLTSKNRNMIRKAQKNSLKVFWGRDAEIIPVFMDIYRKTMDKDNASEYYYFEEDYYKSILEDLKQNAMWFYTVYNEEIASIAIFLFCNGNMHYHLSASRKEISSLAPSNLMLYEAAVWAANHGYKKLHLGGGVGSGEDNLYKFKKAFYRGENQEFWIGRKIFDSKLYEELVSIRGIQNDCKKRFFPLYRANECSE